MLQMTSSRTSSTIAEKNQNDCVIAIFFHFTSIIWPCGRDNFKLFPCIPFKFIMHVTYDQLSDKVNNGWKKANWPIYCDIPHFTSIIWPCGCDYFHVSCSNLVCMLILLSSSRMSSIMAEKNKDVNDLTLWARFQQTFFLYPTQISYACY